jgi:copper chaperone CopZ
MAARIKIKEPGDPAHQKKITDAVQALDGVIETKMVKGALRVSYDPLATTEKKIEQAIRSAGTTIKTAATDTVGAHPDLKRPNVQDAIHNADRRFVSAGGAHFLPFQHGADHIVERMSVNQSSVRRCRRTQPTPEPVQD